MRVMKLAAVLLALLLLSPAQGCSRPPRPAAPLEDLHDIGQLQARFNQDAGTARLVLLLSPT